MKYLIITACFGMLMGCGGTQSSDTVSEVAPPTPEEQVAQSQNDLEVYIQAVSQKDASLCETISFTDLKEKCVREAS